MTKKIKTNLYKRMNFEDYFIICSRNYNKIDYPKELVLAKYESVDYQHGDHTHTVNYQVRFDEKRNCIQIIFQQTASESDWVANFEFPSKLYDKFEYEGKNIQIRAHGGWTEMYFACKDLVRTKFKELLEEYPDAECEIFGWSLGSGLAQLCAEDIYFKFGVKPHLFAYGSVKPFFGLSAKKYVLNCCKEAYCFYDCNDIVGRMVPFLGWWSIGHKKVYLEEFSISKLFNPRKFHTCYDQKELYKNIEE